MIPSQYVLNVGGYALANQPGIHGCTFDDANGVLTVRSSFSGVVNPSFLTVHPNGRWLYTVSETSQQQDGMSGTVWALRCTHEPWSMEPINHQLSGGDSPCHLEIDATGQWLLVSNYGSGTVSVLQILPDGALGEMTDLIQHYGSGPNSARQEGPHTHSATFTPDQRFVIVADLGMDALLVYTFDASDGSAACPHALQVTAGCWSAVQGLPSRWSAYIRQPRTRQFRGGVQLRCRERHAA